MTGSRPTPAPGLPPVVVTNLHRRYTGVSATVRALVPLQRHKGPVGLLDWGGLGLTADLAAADLLRWGWSSPRPCRWRVWHARRDGELALGLLLRSVLRQPWRVLFTSAAPKPPGAWLRWLLHHCDGVIATSERSAGFLPPGRVVAVIPHGVDTSYYTPGPRWQPGWVPGPGDAAGGSGLEGQHLIGCFGRIRPSKGIDLLVEALVTLLPQRPRFSAIFTGLVRPAERAYLEAMQARIRAAGLEHRIRFLGDLGRDSVRDWYRRCLLCVAASRREGFGLTPLEAMACGCAVLSSEAGAWPELIDQEVGRRFATGCQDALTRELARLMDQPDQLAAMGVRARERAVERHSLEAEAAAIEAVYRRLSCRC